MPIQRSESIGASEAMAVVATVLAAMVLTFIREDVDNSVVVLALAAVVSLCGALGGWRAGIAAAVMAALSYNFFHVRPYLSLRIHDADDVLTTATLLLVGAVAGITSSVANRRQARVVASHHDLTAIERVAGLVATGTDAADIETAVRAELLGLLALSACSLERNVDERVARVGRGGALPPGLRVYHDSGFELPSTGIAIPVLQHGRATAHLVCTPTPGIALPVARLRTAVTLADLLGMAYAASPTGPASRRN